jgi:AraC-like DNA-binding protein
MLLMGSFGLGLQHFADDFSPKYRAILIVSLPLLYIYLKAIIFDYVKMSKQDVTHLIFPLLLFGFNYLCFSLNLLPKETTRLITLVLGSLLAIFYLVKCFLLLKTQLWKRRSEIDITHFKLIKNWTFFLFIISAILVTRSISSLIFEKFVTAQLSAPTSTFFLASLWLIVFGKILISPQILFGLPKLAKITNNVREKRVNLDTHWQLEPSQIVNQQDQKLKEKVNHNIDNFISEIESLAKNSNYFRNHKVTIQELANELNVPVSHLVYVFKYHCKLTFIEYKNLIKIEDAEKLIEEGFLKKNTLESLATEVGFSSYNTFFSAFKQHIGKSPNDYANWIKSKSV